MHPQESRFTWHGRVTLASRIDFFLLSPSIARMVSKAEIMSTPISDHSAILIEIVNKSDERGRGFWKFNEKLLHDKVFKKEMNEAIEKVLIKNSCECLDP